MKKVLISLIALFLQSCYQDNHYSVSDASMRLVDYIGRDSCNCSIVKDFSLDRNNELCALGITFQKEFYSDKTKLGASLPKGTKGAEISLRSIQFSEYNESLMSSFYGDSSLSQSSFLSYSQLPNNVTLSQNSSMDCACLNSNFFVSLSHLMESYNRNDKSVVGEINLTQEFYFWIPKKRLLSTLAKSEKLELAFVFSDGSTIKKRIWEASGGSVVK